MYMYVHIYTYGGFEAIYVCVSMQHRVPVSIWISCPISSTGVAAALTHGFQMVERLKTSRATPTTIAREMKKSQA